MAAGTGVFGPYRAGNRWRVLVRAAGDGAGAYQSFSSEAEALDFKRITQEEMAAAEITTVKEAIDAYEDHLKEKGNRESSYVETPRRLRLLFADVTAEALDVLSVAHRCKRLYEKLCEAISPSTNRAYSVDTCRNILAEARTFLAWCVTKKWLRSNGLADVKDQRKRKHGKPQLTRDEARKFTDAALSHAGKDAGAVAALMTLTMGLRATEITHRTARDLDDGGNLLIIRDAKTDAGNRVVRVPDMLRPLLLKLAKGKQPDDLLFGEHWRDWPAENVRRICKLAKVPVVCAHSMRGLHASLAVEEGLSAALVARALGHENPTMTLTSYATREAAGNAAQRAALSVLDGGKSPRKRRSAPAAR